MLIRILIERSCLDRRMLIKGSVCYLIICAFPPDSLQLVPGSFLLGAKILECELRIVFDVVRSLAPDSRQLIPLALRLAAFVGTALAPHSLQFVPVFLGEFPLRKIRPRALLLNFYFLFLNLFLKYCVE